MGKTWRAPGACADCGNDAFIRLGDQDGAEEMVCAHCYAERIREGKLRGAAKDVAPKRATGARPQ